MKRERAAANKGLEKVAVHYSQINLRLIKQWFSESTFVVKIAIFAKPKTLSERR